MIRNLDFIRTLPGFGDKLYEALADLNRQHSTLAQQVNGNSTGQPTPPPGITAVNVTAQNGHFHIAINDPNPIYRGIQYYIEHADNPQFTNAVPIHLGDVRNHDLYLGNVTRYFRAFSSYSSSPAGQPVYFGGPTAPKPVTGGGSDPGPSFLPSQGSGTGTPGVGLSGPGPIPFRSATGTNPVR